MRRRCRRCRCPRAVTSCSTTAGADSRSVRRVFRLAQLAWFMAPAYVANMAPPFARFWPGWNRPINERWLGAHKTAVGAALGIAAGVAAAYAQSLIAWRGVIVSYDAWPAIGLRL